MKIENGLLVDVRQDDISMVMFSDGIKNMLYVPDGVKKISKDSFVDLYAIRNLNIVELPEGLEQIGNNTFAYFSQLQEINFPNSLKEIGDAAFRGTKLSNINLDNVEKLGKNVFEGCVDLKEVDLGDKLKEIPANCFQSCDNLSKIKFPQNLEQIEVNAFRYCGGLESLELPDSVVKIGPGAFQHCLNLENINMPKSLKRLDSYAFNYTNISQIIFPEEIESLSFGVFQNCTALTDVVLPLKLKKIDDFVFQGCNNLKTISLPDNLKEIGESAFHDCSSLEEIIFPNSLENISESAFAGCKTLKNIKLPNNLRIIGTSAFKGTDLSQKVIIPKSVQYLNNSAFEYSNIEEVEFEGVLSTIQSRLFAGCSKLKHVELKEGLSSIGVEAFKGCSELSDIKFPQSLNIVRKKAFENCTRFNKIKLGENVKRIDEYAFASCAAASEIEVLGDVDIAHNAFESCFFVEKVNLPNAKSVGKDVFFNCFGMPVFNSLTINKDCKMDFVIELPYYSERENKFEFTRDERKDSTHILDFNMLPTYILTDFKEELPILERECKDFNVRKLYQTMFEVFEENNNVEGMHDFIKEKNVKFFKQIDLNGEKEEDIKDFIRFYYNLGGFKRPVKETSISKSGNPVEKTVDYAQLVGEFMKEKISSKQLELDKMHMMFESMKNDGFKPEFTKFFLNKHNFDELKQENEMINAGFIARCYNEIEGMQKLNTSHHGSQRQLKPTVEKFKEYFASRQFENITSETAQIANTISGYFSKQEDFDNAVAIDKERKENKVPKNLVSVNLKEKDVFAEIDKLQKSIENQSADMLGVLTSLASKKFTYEWLQKDNPINFILGKLCSCCAHLEGAGYGIMHASIVHPDVQNLVIKDKTGKIVAKSTLYVNRKEGYGVFNNVEINASVSVEDKEAIYQKYIQAISNFAEVYNKENLECPLKQINVGDNLNDLENQLSTHHPKAVKLFKAINYADYGTEYRNYNGDSSHGQFVVWQKPIEQEME